MGYVFNISGYGDVAAAERTLWTGSSIIPHTTAALNMSVSSGSASDTATGTGARSVQILYLDDNGQETLEILALAGTTPVYIKGNIKYIQSMKVMSSGSGGTNAGILYAGSGTVTAGVPATVYERVAIGDSVSYSIRYTAPSGSDIYVSKIEMYPRKSITDLVVSLCITDISGTVTKILKFGFSGTGIPTWDFPPIRLESKSTVSLRISESSVTGTVFATLQCEKK